MRVKVAMDGTYSTEDGWPLATKSSRMATADFLKQDGRVHGIYIYT